MVGFFTIFGAKRNLNEWVTHGMMHACHVGDTWHGACMPCGGVQPIKKGIDGGKEMGKEKKVREKEGEKRKSDSFFL